MTDKLTIGMPCSAFLPKLGGAEVGLHNIAKQLKAKGHSPIVITQNKNAMGLDVPYDVLRWFWPRGSDRLYRLCPTLVRWYVAQFFNRVRKQYGVDVWHCTSVYPTGDLMINYGNLYHQPYLVRATGVDIQKVPDIGYGVRLDPAVDARICSYLPKAQRLVAITESVAEEYRKIKVDDTRISFVPNGVDVSRFAVNVDRSDVLAGLGIAPENYVFTSISRNHPKKNFPTLVRAAAHLKTLTDKPFKVVIAGAGVKELAPLARELGCNDVVVFNEKIGKVEFQDGDVEMPPAPLVGLYKAADAFIFPTLIETFGIVIVEAMAAGLPVVVGDAPGACDVVRHGKDATMVPPMDYEGFAVEMKRLMDDPSYSRELANKSIKRAADFDWSTIADKYLDLYRELIAEKQG